MSAAENTSTLLEFRDWFPAALGIGGVLIGSMISYFSSKRLSEQQGRQETTITLFQEFHSDQMNEWRSLSWSSISSSHGESCSSVFSSASPKAQKALSMFFHYLEKIAALDEAKLLDESLLKATLGRYFHHWFAEAIDKMAPEPSDSEWIPMLEKIKKLRRFAVS